MSKKQILRQSKSADNSPVQGPQPQPLGKAAKKQKTVPAIRPKKIVNFCRGAVVGKCGVAADEIFSDDDDVESKDFKRRQMSLLQEKLILLALSKNRGVALAENLGDCPFQSFQDKMFHSILMFGPVEDILVEWHPECARRTMIILDYYLKHLQSQIYISLDLENEDAARIVPERGISIGDLESTGWKLSEWKTTIRRLVRDLIKLGTYDSGGRFLEEEFSTKDGQTNILLQDMLADEKFVEESEFTGDSDDDEDVDDEIDFSGEQEIYFTECLKIFQKGQIDSLEEVDALVQLSKRQKVELDEMKERMEEISALQESAEVRASEAEKVRVHQLLMAEKEVEMAQLKLKTAGLEVEMARLKASAPSVVGGGSQTLLVRTVTDDQFVVKKADAWEALVKLQEEIREHLSQWDEERFLRQFSEDVVKDMVLRLTTIRSAGRLPEKLAGFDGKTGGKWNLFIPSAEHTRADVLEWYLLAQNRDKKGKKLPTSLGATASNDTFVKFLDSEVTKKWLALTDEVGNGTDLLKRFDVVADRFELVAAERAWDEELKKFLRVPTDPPLDAAAQAAEVKYSKTFLAKAEAAYKAESQQGGLMTWTKSICQEMTAKILAEGWVTTRDTVHLWVELHTKKAARCAEFRAEDPRYQGVTVEKVSPPPRTDVGKPPNARKRGRHGGDKDYYGPEGADESGGGGADSSEKVEKPKPTKSCPGCGGSFCNLAGLCMFSSRFAKHPDRVQSGVFSGSELEKTLKARGQVSLGFGYRADGSKWEMSEESRAAIKEYKRQARAAREAAQGKAPAPRKDAAGVRSAETVSHSPEHCDVCCKLQDVLHDITFSARANMFISPSKGGAKSEPPSIGGRRIAETTKAVGAAGLTTSVHAREETSVGEEREVSVLLDTGASGRNFISSKLASWLIERGSSTFFESGEVGLAQQGKAIQFHQHLSFELRFVNSKLGIFEVLSLCATIIEDLRIDVILGLPTVGKYRLLPKVTTLCGDCSPPGGATTLCVDCTPLGGAAQELVYAGGKSRHRSVIPNVSNPPKESLPGSLTTEIDQSARAQASTVPQPGGVPGADCELCTLQVRSDQIFGPAEQ